MPECPNCGKMLDTESGMRQHHTNVHGKPLPNRTCLEKYQHQLQVATEGNNNAINSVPVRI